MLHKSFKAGKCKTSLKLAVARVKLLRNRKEAQVRQLKGELAQLLEAGKEQTARIRVEHVVREEKFMAAYDLLEIYCELIVARLPIIESQKNCPIDLKEAISSVIFASPRCGDVPELLDVRKHFTAKYGKEFTASALELRPDCGVSRIMVEKLSATAPDGQTKMKILTVIAQEHNISWDPNSLSDKDLKSSEDLLNGPSIFETASKMPMKPPDVQFQPNSSQRYGSSTNLSQNSVTRSSLSSQASDSTKISTLYETLPASFYPEPRASEREFGHPFTKDESAFALKRQNWIMEFRDATSAAEAAAESAERASMAARAAAELSSRGKISRQHSTESHESSINGLRNEGFRNLSGPQLQEPVTKDSVNMGRDSPKRSSGSMNPGMQNQWGGRNEQDKLLRATERISGGHASNKRTSSRSISCVSTDDDNVILNSDLQKYRNGEHSFIGNDQGNMEIATKKLGSSDYPSVAFDESGSDDDPNFTVESMYNGHESKFYFPSPSRKSPSRLSENTNMWNHWENMSEPLEKEHGAGSHFVSKLQSSSEFSEQRIKSGDPSQSDDFLRATFDDSDGLNSESEEKNNVNISGRTGSISRPHKQNAFPRSPASTQNSRNRVSTGSSFLKNEATRANQKPMSQSFSDDSDSDEVHFERNKEIKLNIVGRSSNKYGLGDFPTDQPSPRCKKSPRNLGDLEQESFYSSVIEEEQPLQSRRVSLAKEAKAQKNSGTVKPRGNMENPELLNHSSSESGLELNFGRLTGGLRHKGYRRPPYTGGPSVDASVFSRKQAVEDTPTIMEQPSVSPTIKTWFSYENYDQESYNQKMCNGHKELSSRTSKTYSDSDSDDVNDEPPLPTVGSKSYTGSRLSQRTRDSPKQSETSTSSSSTVGSNVPVTPEVSMGRKSSRPSYAAEALSRSQSEAINSASGEDSKLPRVDVLVNQKQSETGTSSSTVGSKVPVTPELAMGRKSSRSSFAAEALSRSQSQAINSGSGEDSKLPRVDVLVNQKPSKPMPESKISVPVESSKFFQPSSAVKQPANPLPKTLSSGSSESQKISSLSGGSATRENSLKKASHVHPNLPDYDTLAAHFATLRSNRR